jgi:replication initiation protein RepC
LLPRHVASPPGRPSAGHRLVAGEAGTGGDGQGAEVASGRAGAAAPRLMPYLRRPSPIWPELVEAADWLRHDLDVSKPLWGEACLAMGREQAAIALAVVSTKDLAHFRTTPGGYFHGMVAKAKAGELNEPRSHTLGDAPSRRAEATSEDRPRGKIAIPRAARVGL